MPNSIDAIGVRATIIIHNTHKQWNEKQTNIWRKYVFSYFVFVYLPWLWSTFVEFEFVFLCHFSLSLFLCCVSGKFTKITFKWLVSFFCMNDVTLTKRWDLKYQHAFHIYNNNHEWKYAIYNNKHLNCHFSKHFPFFARFMWIRKREW